MRWSYNSQYRTRNLSVMPTNFYCPSDNDHPEKNHVPPALIRKLQEAKVASAPTVTALGTAWLRRVFLYSEDLVDTVQLVHKLARK